MSNTSPPIEQQRFARSQTPESPRPVHVPEPANIPVLQNQMDQASNDLATYNIPSDQTFAQYGDTLENAAWKGTQSKEEQDPIRDFLRKADSAVTNPNPSEPTMSNYSSASQQFTNHAGLSMLGGQIASNSNADGSDVQRANNTNTYGTQATQQPHGNDYQTNEVSTNTDAKIETQETERQTTQEQRPPQEPISDVKTDAGVDYQSLLDNLSQSASTAPTSENVVVQTTEDSKLDAQTSSLPSFPGLPPKPPPVDVQNALPASNDSAQAHQQPISSGGYPSHQPAASGYLYPTNHTASSTSQMQSGSNGTKPANPFDTGMTNEQAIAMHMQYSRQGTQQEAASPPSRDETATEPSDRPWSPRTQARYDDFLENERRYVTEGIWDRFPMGSRLFVGNLPSEKVTKRDLFHRFHRFGRLAQISIKQAYGFVQFHDSESCKAALDSEQGVEIRGRKVHLEVSKPQKGSKASQPQPNKNQNQSQSQNRKRSRSPPRRSHSEYRDEPGRRRDEYRRSPSPPRRRDSRDRRSPIYGSDYSTPQTSAYDDEAALPYPRRDPRYVPDVQVIVLDQGMSSTFLNWVEDGFRRKGLGAATTILNQRTPLPAVVKRQIFEGVQAVVKLTTGHQNRSKIPLQVFDRAAGTSNITFNEYADLDVPVAADIVAQARQRERSGGMQARPSYPTALPPQSPYTQQQSPSTPWQQPGPPQTHFPYPPPPQHQTYDQLQYPPQQQQQFRPPQPPQLQYPTPNSTSSNPPNLQELLNNLKGGSNAPPTPQSAHSAGVPHSPFGQPPQPPQPQYSQYPPQQQQAPLQQPYAQYSLPPFQQLQHQVSQHQQPQQQQQPQHQQYQQQNAAAGQQQQQQTIQYLLDQEGAEWSVQGRRQGEPATAEVGVAVPRSEAVAERDAQLGEESLQFLLDLMNQDRRARYAQTPGTNEDTAEQSDTYDSEEGAEWAVSGSGLSDAEAANRRAAREWRLGLANLLPFRYRTRDGNVSEVYDDGQRISNRVLRPDQVENYDSYPAWTSIVGGGHIEPESPTGT